ncbi:hypothetical protein [Gimesia maris]|uniref:Uncharacterized protein n=1 Tax=Gimesia maris TaxID=122 RepID=A0ABX5YMW6_9PLAN|nr:hypothetical protein [Gimesia maris]QEG17034.1 hypothetical protein GmarT_29050 [Gimesia maris]
MLPRLRFYSIAFLLCGSLLPTTQAADQQPLTKEVINQTWKARRERLQAMRIELSLDVTRNTLPYMRSAAGGDDEEVPLTEEETLHYLNQTVNFKTHYSLILDSPRIRCRHWGRVPTPQLEQMQDLDMTGTTDGKTAALAYKYEGIRNLTIYKSSVHPMLPLFDLNPLRWSLLAGDPVYGFTLDQYKVCPQLEKVQGIACTVLEKSEVYGGLKRLWVAPTDRECVVMKYTGEQSGQYHSQHDFHYVNLPNEGPEPKYWTTKSYQHKSNQDIFTYGCRINVDSFDSCATVTPADFQLELTTGTHVTDTRKRNPQGGELIYDVK